MVVSVRHDQRAIMRHCDTTRCAELIEAIARAIAARHHLALGCPCLPPDDPMVTRVRDVSAFHVSHCKRPTNTCWNPALLL